VNTLIIGGSLIQSDFGGSAALNLEAVIRASVRSILGKTERGGDFLHSIKSREL
jgi:hypothetical protein